MPERPLSVVEFRTAEADFERALLAVLRRHCAALGGELGLLHALLETAGSVAAALLLDLGDSEAGDRAQRHLEQQIAALALFITNVRATRQ